MAVPALGDLGVIFLELTLPAPWGAPSTASARGFVVRRLGHVLGKQRSRLDA